MTATDMDSIEASYRHFHGRVRMNFGWGTNLTNDFTGLDPDGHAGACMKISLPVCRQCPLARRQ